MILYDSDKMKEAIAAGVQLDADYYYDAYWFSLNTKGTTVAMRDGDYVIQYMGIENPGAEGYWEQWSCLGQYQDFVGTFHGEVFNYDYSRTLLTNDEVALYDLDYQTYYHPNYDNKGAWTMGASSKYYTTYFDGNADVTGITCTGVRQVGRGQKGYFSFDNGDTINVRVGFRVYTDAQDPVPRLSKDYQAFQLELLGATTLLSSAVALITLSFLF